MHIGECYLARRKESKCLQAAHFFSRRGRRISGVRLGFPFRPASVSFRIVTAKTFRHEIAQATKAYEKYVVCLNKTPDEFEAALHSLLGKAIRAYEGRGPDLRHGIALDNQVTVILSQSDSPRPLCGIYFNLHSPYRKQSLPKTVRAVTEPIGEGRPDSEE
jgi:hypothetical protein